MDTDDETYKPDLIVFSEHYCAVSDALGVCKFTTAETYALYPDDLAAGLSALWEREISGEELLTAGERIVNLERLYNVRLGLSRADDRLPARFTEEPLEVHSVVRRHSEARRRRADRTGVCSDFDRMLDRYYRLRGWSENGVPTPETLRETGVGTNGHRNSQWDGDHSWRHLPRRRGHRGAAHRRRSRRRDAARFTARSNWTRTAATCCPAGSIPTSTCKCRWGITSAPTTSPAARSRPRRAARRR